MGLFKKLLGDTNGVTAVELALLLPPVTFILFAIIETSFVFLIAIVLEGATSTAARQIRTGTVQATDAPVEAFNNILCENLFDIVPCNEVIIDVRNFTQFSGIDVPALTPEGEGTSFSPGNSGDVVVVRAIYEYEFITPMLATALISKTGSSKKVIESSNAFRNEPD